jgi:hypothetical protein
MKNLEKGVTIVEIAVVIFLIVLFSMIIISDFPKIQRQRALSNAAYKLAQDLRRAEDLGLSGITIKDKYGEPILARGYGIFIDYKTSDTKYIIYADMNGGNSTEYGGNFSTTLCSNQDSPSADCPIEIIDWATQSSGLVVTGINNRKDENGRISINFMPPDPTVTIDNIRHDKSDIEIVLQNKDGLEKKVFVNTAGLINVE